MEICKAVTPCVDTPANAHNNQNVRVCQRQHSRGGRLDRKHGCITVCHRPGDSTSGVSRTVGSVAISCNAVFWGKEIERPDLARPFSGATTENLHFLLFIVCRPIIGRDYFEECHIHFTSSFMLSVSSAYTKKLSFLHVWATRKKGWQTLYKKGSIWRHL